jgi:hypothetical protein
MFANGGGNGSDDEVQEFVEKDRCEHQDCYYSTSSSRSCRSINGESKCDLLRRVFRQCPGEPQREVFASHSTEEGGGGAAAQIGGALGDGGGLGDFFLGGGGARGEGGAGGRPGVGAMADPFALMEEMMGQFFGGGAHGGMHGGYGAEHHGGGGGVPDGQERHRRWQQEQQQEQTRRQPEMPAPHRFPRGRYAPEARSAEPPRTFDARDFKGPVEDV